VYIYFLFLLPVAVAAVVAPLGVIGVVGVYVVPVDIGAVVITFLIIVMNFKNRKGKRL